MKGKTLLVLALMVSMTALGIFGCGGGGGSVAVTPAGTAKLILTADSDDATVTVVNAATLVVEQTIPLSIAFPWEITVSDDNTLAYVSCRGARDGVDKGGIVIVDLVNFVELDTITGLTGSDPSETEIVGDTMYVAFVDNYGLDANDLISVIDLSVTPPVETGFIDLAPYDSGLLSLAATADGSKLYAGSMDTTGLHVIDLTVSPAVLDTTVAVTAEYLYLTMDNGLLYLPGGVFEEIEVLDTATDTLLPAESVLIGTDGLYLQGVEKIGSNFWAVTSNAGLAKIDSTRDMTDFDWFYGDDDHMTITLPFVFTFEGTNYTEIFMGTNGVLTFDENYADNYNVEPGENLGFSPNMADLDNGDGNMFNISYNVSVDGQRAVFQWSTATSGNDSDPSVVTIFEMVLFQDGRARFDYMGSEENAIGEDDGYGYGVGDGAGTDILELRAIYGSAYGLSERSFMWDPATPGTVTEVPYTFEGTGVLWMPVPGTPHGLVKDGTTLYTILPKDNLSDNNTTNNLAVFDTVTEDGGLVTVGNGPRAVALVY